jgi:hypothetical protein
MRLGVLLGAECDLGLLSFEISWRFLWQFFLLLWSSTLGLLVKLLELSFAIDLVLLCLYSSIQNVLDVPV